MKTTVLLVDDHPIVIAGFAKLLDDNERYEVVKLVSSGEEAIAYLQNHPVDVAIVDINMEGMDGLKATRRLKAILPTLKIVILSVNEVEPFISKSFESGANAFLSKRCAPDELANALDTVCRGGQYLSEHIRNVMVADKLDNKEDLLKTLTEREFEVFRCLVRGDSMNDIADTLHISPKTGYAFRGKLFKKLKVTTLVELTHMAHRLKII